MNSYVSHLILPQQSLPVFETSHGRFLGDSVALPKFAPLLRAQSHSNRQRQVHTQNRKEQRPCHI